MCRMVGIMPMFKKYSELFSGCKTSHARIKRLRQILAEAGMKGEIKLINTVYFDPLFMVHILEKIWVLH